MSDTAHPIGDRWKMSLATELLRKVEEAKKSAADEMGVPKYDNIHTPDNHVGNTGNATKERPVSGLGDRKMKKPTANVGSPGKEKRDMEGVKSVKVSENVFQDLGLTVENGLISFHDQHGQVHSIEADRDSVNFVKGALRQTRGDSEQMLELLMDYFEGGAGYDPKNQNPVRQEDRVGLAAGAGDWPLSENTYGNNPVAAALSMRPVEGGMLYMQSPDGQAAMMVPMSGPVQKALSAYMTNPDARADTHGAAERLFKLVGQKVPGVKAVRPTGVKASKAQSGVRGKGVAANAGSGLSLAPMESAHKTADGEMTHPSVSSRDPAKSVKVRGKQNDEPANKGNPGTGKEEKGQPKKQFDASPKDSKGGENEHKSMKKMHEALRDLENLLGRELQLEAKPSAGLSKKKKSSVAKKARAGKDIGKKGKGFDKVKRSAAASGARDPEAVAAAAMWKNVKR